MLTQGLLRRACCSPALQESELFRDLAQSSGQLLHFTSPLRNSNSSHADTVARLRSVGTLSPPATWDLLSASKQVVIKTSAGYIRNDFWPGACSQTLRICVQRRGSGMQEVAGTPCLWWIRQRKRTGLPFLLPHGSDGGRQGGQLLGAA